MTTPVTVWLEMGDPTAPPRPEMPDVPGGPGYPGPDADPQPSPAQVAPEKDVRERPPQPESDPTAPPPPETQPQPGGAGGLTPPLS